MEDFNCSSAIIHAVVHVQRGVEKPPELRMSLYWCPDVRMSAKQFDVVEKIISKLFGCFGVVLPRPIEDFLKIG